MGAYYFLGNQLLGTSRKSPMWSDTTEQLTNVGMMCDTCGEVWARVVNSMAHRWTFQMRLCGKHGNGSFIAAWANQFEELPPEVLRYELLLRLDKYERESNREQKAS